MKIPVRRGAYGGTGSPSSEYKELYSFFYFYANNQRNVTCDIYYYLTIELDHTKHDSRLAACGGVVLQRLKGLNL